MVVMVTLLTTCQGTHGCTCHYLLRPSKLQGLV
uniref:Uncharacterized protein n=1 Tax=Arundo donax TaxID=35708 RepID=A0A0A8Y4A2_ARUDO